MDGIAVVTGAGSGLGAAIALELARAGMLVVCAGRRADRIDAVAGQIRGEGRASEAVVMDVTDPALTDAVLGAVASRHERIDVLVNNAGAFSKAMVHEISDQEWQRIVETNLTGAFFCSRSALKIMLDQPPIGDRRGHIVNINSGAGLVGYPTGASYSASKFGLLGLSDTLRREYADRGIAVTDVVVAAMVDSELSNRAQPGRLPAHLVGNIVVDALRIRERGVVTRVDLGALPPLEDTELTTTPLSEGVPA